jgi:hypothetical protein
MEILLTPSVAVPANAPTATEPPAVVVTLPADWPIEIALKDAAFAAFPIAMAF